MPSSLKAPLCLCLAFVGLSAVTTRLSAQDPHFSQFFINRIYLNPAFTGIDRGVTMHAVGRMQWFGYDTGYKVYNASVEWQEPVLNSGIGLNVYGSYDGILNYNTTSIGLNYAYTIAWEQNNIHIGLQARWIQHRINWSKAIFSDQLDPILGNTNPTTADISNDQTSFFDMDFGLVWRFDAGKSFSGRSISTPRYAIGIAVHHLPSLLGQELGGNNSILNLPSSTPARLTVHAGAIYPITFLRGSRRSISVSPQFRMDLQGDEVFNFDENLVNSQLGVFTIFGAFYTGLFYQGKWPLPIGGGNTNTMVVHGGFQFGDTEDLDFLLGLSVDVNLTGVSVSSGLVYELVFRYNFEAFTGVFRRPGHRSSILKCNTFF